MNSPASMFVELRALLNADGVRHSDECCHVPLTLKAEQGHLEIAVVGDRLRLRVVVMSLHEPTPAECLCMLDWNHFAACAGGVFAIDENGVKYLVRHVACGLIADAQSLHELVTSFSADACALFDELYERAAALRQATYGSIAS